MGLFMKLGKTGLDQDLSDANDGTPEVTAVGGAVTLTVSVSYPYASDGDACRVAFYPRGSEAPAAIFSRPGPIAEGTIELAADRPAGSHTFDDVPTGEYDVYYELRTSRGDATAWTNTAPHRLSETPEPVQTSVGMVAPQDAAGAASYFGDAGGSVTLGL